MTTAYTSLLGFALPVTGELNGTWGDVVNNSITQLVEDSVAGQATASVASGDWTLTTSGSGVANQARCAILIPTGSPGVSRNIIAPSSSKAYVVINQSNAAVVLKGAATTGVTIPTGKKMLCAWNGSDFVQIGESGTVTAVSVASANGFAGTSSGGATPALTLSTTVTGIVKGNGTALSAATSGTDYAPATSGSAILYGNGAGGFSSVTIGSGVSFAGGTLSATGTGGDVVGPASSTNTAVALFDGTTGKLLKNSVMTVASDGASVLSVNSASDGLRITQIGAGNALVVEDSANPDTTPFVIQNAGTVLIGDTTSRAGILGAYSNVQSTGAWAYQGSAYSADAFGTGIALAKSRSATIGTQTVVQSGDAVGNIFFAGSDGTQFIELGRIAGAVDGTPGTNDMPGRLVFSTTADGASSPTERMRITANGGVSFGATGTAYGTAGQVLQSNGNAPPTWVNAATGTVTAVSVASANGFAGTSSGGATPALTLSTSVTGIVKGNGTALSAAVSGTDYAPATSGSSILYGNGSGGFSNVAVGSGISFAGGTLSATGSGGTVTAVSVASANGFAGTSSGGATPALTLSTSITGMLKGNGTAISAGTANSDYLVPALANTAVTGFKTATFNSQLSTGATTTGAITINWTNAQNQIQTEPTGTITYTFTAPPGPCHLQLLINSDGTSTAQTINWPGTVIQLGATWAGANNKKSIINFWYDGTNYYMVGTNQV